VVKLRSLKFIVNGQIIEKDPSCDFDNLVPGSDGYLKAEFTFSPEWKDCVKIASFYSAMGKEYTPQLIQYGKTCDIPAEALERRTFKIKVTGFGRDGNKTIITDKVAISQNGGKK
jgi:hypothetical protein